MDRAGGGGCQGERWVGGARHHDHGLVVLLRVRHVNRRQIVAVEPLGLDFAYYSDDLLHLIVSIRGEPRTDRASLWPKVAGQGLVDNRHGRRVRRIARVEVPASEEWNSHRMEV